MIHNKHIRNQTQLSSMIFSSFFFVCIDKRCRVSITDVNICDRQPVRVSSELTDGIHINDNNYNSYKLQQQQAI